MPRSEADVLAGGVPWPAGLLPHLGLLLLVLLAVKLFRPKTLADFWIIQTIGMMIVTLGCVLAGDLLFAALMVLYLASLVWCLALFQLYRGQRPAAPGPLFGPAGAAPMTARLPWRRLGVTRALRWSLVVVAVGLPLFMLMPRSGNQQWVPQKLASAATAALTVGADSGINLNRVGTIELSPAPAFHVTVTDPDGKPARLSTQQYWRVEILDFYARGHWMNWFQAQDFQKGDLPHLPSPEIEPHAPARPLPGQRALRFGVQPSLAGGLALAEPVDLRYAGVQPLAGTAAPGLPLFQPIPGADAAKGVFLPSSRAAYHYTQFLSGADQMDRQPARFYEDSYVNYLKAQPVPEPVALWARQQLGELPLLTAVQRRLDPDGHLPAAHHAAVSAAFCHYFAHAGAYRYSLTLKRQAPPPFDATADFLLNVKTGHCERFAAALALARAQPRRTGARHQGLPRRRAAAAGPLRRPPRPGPQLGAGARRRWRRRRLGLAHLRSHARRRRRERSVDELVRLADRRGSRVPVAPLRAQLQRRGANQRALASLAKHRGLASALANPRVRRRRRAAARRVAPARPAAAPLAGARGHRRPPDSTSACCVSWRGGSICVPRSGRRRWNLPRVPLPPLRVIRGRRRGPRCPSRRRGRCTACASPGLPPVRRSRPR